jgi:pimeloyl-ACP methyl ester carboxylesterase
MTLQPGQARMLIQVVGVLLILTFRSACLGRARPRPAPVLQLISGLWLGVAVWIAGALLHAWVPIWQMTALGLLLAAAGWAVARRLPVNTQLAVDVLAVCALAWLSIIPVRITPIIVAAAAFAAAGYVIDGMTMRLPRWRQRNLLVAPVLLVVVLLLKVQQVGDFGTRLQAQDPLLALRLVLVAADPGDRVVLPSGAAAWSLRNPRGDPRGVAVLLHGNDQLASAQPAATALQGALLRAGYDVLSVDHPGYGASPVPSADADWSAWDPTIGPKEALAYARTAFHPDGPGAIVIGHSAGVDVALHWLRDGATVRDVYLFGGSIDRPTGPELEWNSQFREDRGLPCCRNMDTMRLVRDRFYSGADRFAAALPPAHAVVHFVRFGIEFADVASVRDALYAAITPPKTACSFAGVTHFFNTLSLWRFVLIDSSTVIREAAIFATPDTVTPATALCPR